LYYGLSINYKCVLVAGSEKVQNVWVIYVLDNTLYISLRGDRDFMRRHRICYKNLYYWLLVIGYWLAVRCALRTLQSLKLLV